MDSDIRWCRYLNKYDYKYSLLKTTNIKEGNLIVCQQTKFRQFAKFENHIEFMKFQTKVESYENCFYEIMTEDMKRKPYFDIDIKRYNEEDIEEGNKIIKQIKDSIKVVLKEKDADIEKAQILVYTSHTDKKLSYHIVVHGYYFKDHHECRNFYNSVSEKCDYSFQRYIDCSVYKTIQQLRIIGSHKYQKKNYKVLSKSLTENFVIPERYLRFPKGKESYITLTSLVSNITDCEYLTGFEFIQPDIDYGRVIYLTEKDAENLECLKNINSDDSDSNSPIISKNQGLVKVKLPGKSGTATDADLDPVLNLFYQKYSNIAFKFNRALNCDGNLIITFLRKKGTMCNMCQRKHYNENPYVKVSGINRDLYFHCRRTPDDRGELFGSLGEIKLDDVNVNDIVQLESSAPAKDILEKEEEKINSLNNLEESLSVKKDNQKGDLSKDLTFLKL